MSIVDGSAPTAGTSTLIARRQRLLRGLRQVAVGEVRYQLRSGSGVENGPPTGREARSHGVLPLVIRAEVDLRTAGWRPVAAYLRIRFDDPKVRAGGLSASASPSVPVMTGSGTETLGWFFDPLRADPHESLAIAVNTLVEVPPGLTALTGTLMVETALARRGPFRSPCHARTEPAHEFAFVLPGSAAAVSAPPVVEQLPGRQASVRLCLAADIEKFSRHRNPEALHVQRRFMLVLAEARKQAGIPEDLVDTQHSGDGQFAVLPTGLDESVVIPALVQGLAAALEQANADVAEQDRLRLRVALARGHIVWGANGWIGDCTIAVHRLLDSQPTRDALTRRRADFSLIISDVVFQDVVAHGYGSLHPESFTDVEVAVPAKNFFERAWVYEV